MEALLSSVLASPCCLSDGDDVDNLTEIFPPRLNYNRCKSSITFAYVSPIYNRLLQVRLG